MIHIDAVYLNGGFLFECKGHAGYGEYGKDIVCAGVSALCMSLVSRFKEMEDENMIHIVDYYVSDGELSVKIAYPTEGIVKFLTEECIKTVLAGLSSVAALYRDYVDLN